MYLFHFFSHCFLKKIDYIFFFGAKTRQPFHAHTLKQIKELIL
jgi:hypothetical protein